MTRFEGRAGRCRGARGSGRRGRAGRASRTAARCGVSERADDLRGIHEAGAGEIHVAGSRRSCRARRRRARTEREGRERRPPPPLYRTISAQHVDLGREHAVRVDRALRRAGAAGGEEKARRASRAERGRGEAVARAEAAKLAACSTSRGSSRRRRRDRPRTEPSGRERGARCAFGEPMKACGLGVRQAARPCSRTRCRDRSGPERRRGGTARRCRRKNHGTAGRAEAARSPGLSPARRRPAARRAHVARQGGGS